MTSFVEYALKYASLGWHVFPLIPRQKIPFPGTHGVKDATTDETQIKAWWTKWPDANIGFACGIGSGPIAVDVDVEESTGINGYDALKELSPLPGTVFQNTPRGGIHVLFKAYNSPKNSPNFRPGISIRCRGYYIVLTPSIHPNGGQYAWGEGCAPWERSLAEYPDFMRPTVRAPWAGNGVKRSQVPNAPHTAPTAPAEDDMLRRASLYLAQCDAAIQGCGGHGKLFWAAGCMTWGCGLSADQAIDILTREYNPRCVPPWDFSLPKDSRDFQRKVTESIKKPPDKPRLWILNDSAYAPIISEQMISKGDIVKLIGNSKLTSNKVKVSSNTQAELDFLCRPPGLVGEICQWINATSMSPQPFLTLACVLAFCGVLFGRKVRDTLDTRTNLYCLGVASSSAGKNHAPKQIRKIAHYAGCGALIGGDDVASDTAIEECLARSPATLCMWDEIGFLLSYIRSGVSQHHARIIPQLMKLYSSAGSVFKGKMYADSENQRTIIQPCFSLYGTSTFKRFIPGISDEQIEDGWLARCLVFRTHVKPHKKRESIDAPVPQHIQDQVSAWFARQIGEIDSNNIGALAVYHGSSGETIEQPPQQIIIPRAPEAEQLFIAFDNESCAYGESNPVVATLWLKSEENARKIALILAAGENFDNPYITYPIADYSCRLIRHLLLDFGKEIVPVITTGQIDSQKQKILSLIENSGIKGCPNREVVQRMRNTIKKQREGLIADLIEAQEIIGHVMGDRKALTYWTPENFHDWSQRNDP